MASTTNLNLTCDLSTTATDSENDVPAHLAAANSNFKIIDEFAGKIYGASGTITLSASGWTDSAYTVEVAELGENDGIVLSPASETDRDNAAAANLFQACSAGSITISAEETPSDDITFKYFIMRGK